MQVIAIGGGGFSDGTEPGLDRYVLAQSRAATPRIGFIGTASGDADRYLVKFYARFARLDCRPSHLSFFGRTPDLEAWVLGQDVLYVGGGNTRSLLGVWNEWGLPPLLRRAAEAGTVLSGISAGAICWFEQGVTDSSSSALGAIACLSLVPGSCCPHYSGEAERRPAYEGMVAAGEIAPGYAIDDGAALHWAEGKPIRVVAGRPGADVYRVESHAGAARSVPVEGVERLVLEPEEDPSSREGDE
jgi:peptidase E